MKLLLKGLRVEKYIGKQIEGHNCDFNYYPEEQERYVFNCLGALGQKFELILSKGYGECGSGWCSASWGNAELREVQVFNGTTHRPIKDIEFTINKGEEAFADYSCEVFNVNYGGGDSYYPCGGISVNMELFKENGRQKDKRPVWIFCGDSSLGKTYLSSIIRNSDFSKTVYETDCDSELPEQIIEDIIVVGNKYNFNIDEVKKRIFGDSEVIMVNFNK